MVGDLGLGGVRGWDVYIKNNKLPLKRVAAPLLYKH